VSKEAAVYEHVFRPGAIGPLTLPHRIVMGSMHLGLEGRDDGGAALAAFYRARAAGGAGLIVTGGSAVSRVAASGRNYSFIIDDAESRRLEGVAAAVHAEGARVILQVLHAGRYASERWFGLQPVAPSPIPSHMSGSNPRELSEEEILDTIEDFARAAARARELGFDGVEIMGSEGYLLNQFTAPATNQRDDDWGGDPERRRRFPLEVARAVREASGPGQAVVYRMSGVDLVPGGTPHEEVLALARELAAGPVDALNVGVGWHEARIPTVQGPVPAGAWRPWSLAVKQVVDVPVVVSNRLHTLAVAEEALAAGDADFVSMARPFLADPEIVAKGRPGDGRATNHCISCNVCVERSIFDRDVTCVVNPRAGRELEEDPAPPEPVAVAVVGAGPAGMEAARALAAAGYRVELFEAGDELGGQFRMARRIPGKDAFGLTIDYFTAELERLGVTVRLGTRVEDPAALDGFGAVVVATGVVPREVALPGADGPHVSSYADVLLDGTFPSGGRVAIVGAGGIGVDLAHAIADGEADSPAAFYARHKLEVPVAGAAADGDGAGGDGHGTGTRVTVMRRGGRVAEGVGAVARWVVLQALEHAEVEVLTGVDYERIEADAMVVRDADGTERRIPADAVILAAGQEPERTLAERLADDERPVLVIGGAAEASGLDAERAFREATAAPRLLAEALRGAASAT